MKSLNLILLLVFSSLSLANSDVPNNRHISIRGEAQVTAKPDIAVVSFQVESFQPSSLKAKKDVDARVNNLLEGLASFDIDENDISASSISTEPNYRYLPDDKKELDGFTAYRKIKVTINNLKKLNSFMDFALSVKVDEIDSIKFKSSKMSALKDEVNALAVRNAKEKGQSLANAFDAKLGKIYSINSTATNLGYRYGSNSDVEIIEVSGVRGTQPDRAGKYLQANIVLKSSINVVFDLDVM